MASGTADDGDAQPTHPRRNLPDPADEGLHARHALDLVDYWYDLGISDLYAAPFLKAAARQRARLRRGRSGIINPRSARGRPAAVCTRRWPRARWASDGRRADHMCVAATTTCVDDVLESGPASRYARYFDIDWRPPREELRGKVLTRAGPAVGKVLEAGRAAAVQADWALWVSYYERRFPISTGSYPWCWTASSSRPARPAPRTISSLTALANLTETARALRTAPDDSRRRRQAGRLARPA